jgi:hypothetical protein
VPDHTPAAEPDDEVADAVAAVEGLHRTGLVVRVPMDPTATGPGSRPFWASLVGTPDDPPATLSPPRRSHPRGEAPDSAEGAPQDGIGSTDLIITSLRPDQGGDHTGDLVALVAARLLRVGGILAVLTHCDWTVGELTDPTGAVVASAQNADLLYLQHIVALHAPVRAGRFAVDSLTASGRTATDDQARAAHRAAVRGLPAPHRRIHSDVLLFAQPHAYEPRSVSPTGQAFDTGVIR